MKLSLSSVVLASIAVSTTSAFAPVASITKSHSVSTTRVFAEDDDADVKKSMSDDLWGTPTPKPDAPSGDMSQALPFAPRPKLLDGTLAGDVGFDPFGFAGSDKASLLGMREAEIKHGRLAMLAVVGWPLAELFDRPLAELINRPDLLTRTGESPSLLNGGLERIEPEYWVFVVSIAGLVELAAKDRQEKMGKDYIPGDCGFDPLNLFPENKADQLAMQTKEIKHGRVAMMAILGFVVQEALYRTPVVSETPFFFHPIF